MHKEEVIIRILGKALEFLAQEEVTNLRSILEEELYNYEVQPISTAIIPYESIDEKLMLFLVTKTLKGLSVITLNSYRQHLKRFSMSTPKKVENIDAMDIKMYLAKCIKSGLKKSSIATETWILRSFFTWLENENYIVKSPMRKIETVKKEKRIRISLTPEELEKLRLACKTLRETAMVEFFYSTGCRLDEVCKLNISDIDWNSKSLHVIGKGDSERIVYLNAKAKVHLKRYLDSRLDSNIALFVGERKPYRRLGHRAFQTDFHDLGIIAGITKSVHPHIMRHTMATVAVNNGASLQSVKNMLGHESVSTTEIYADLNTDEIQISHRKYVS